MSTGACGINCDTCRLHLRGICTSCGAGNGPLGKRKLAAQFGAFKQQCPILVCAHEKGIAYCLRDCRRFPCDIFKRGPAPFSRRFLDIQQLVRKRKRRPSMDLPAMADWQFDELDPSLWDGLREADPARVCRNAMVAYDSAEECYRVVFLQRPYRVYPFRRILQRESSGRASADCLSAVSYAEAVVLLSYLSSARETDPSGRWVGEKDVTGGEHFFRGSHALTREPVLSRFGDDPEGFVEAGRGVGGVVRPLGDGAVEVRALPKIPLTLILWSGGVEFSPALSVTFDSTVDQHLRLDAIWALVHVCVSRLSPMTLR